MAGFGAQDLYAELGVDPDASAQSIRHAYRGLARRLHPDVDPGNEQAFRRVSAAYEVLGDPQRRAAYDRACDASKSVALRGPAAERRAPAPTGNVGPSPPRAPRITTAAVAQHGPARDEWQSLASLVRWVVIGLVAALVVFTLLALAVAGRQPAKPFPSPSPRICHTSSGWVDCRSLQPMLP